MRHLLATTRARCRRHFAVAAVAAGLIVVLLAILIFNPYEGGMKATTAAKASTAEKLPDSPPTPTSATSDVESAVRYVEGLSNLSDGDEAAVLDDLTHLDIALAANRLIDPHLDESSIRDRISAMGDAARDAWKKSVSSGGGPEGRISALSDVIFDTYGFSDPPNPNKEDPIITGRGVFDTYALPGVLDGKRGYCEGLSTVYLLVAEAAGIPGVSTVNLPVHTLIRVDMEDGRPIYVETMMGGALRSPSYVNSMNFATEAAASSGVYLSPLTKRQFLNLQVNALAYGLAMQSDGRTDPLSADQMVRLAGAIERLDSGRPESLDTAALIHYQVGRNAKAAVELMGRVVVLAERYGAPDWLMDHYREVRAKYAAAVESDESTRAYL